MVSHNTLREVIGAEEFDAAIEQYRSRERQRTEKNVPEVSETHTKRMTIEEGRAALARASERSFD